ncbi:MAG: hypothetical protein H6855_02100 [Rhodospirillales bacterium]|nr:hypothetical protein [Rhodospirillales bacterium]
MKFTVNVEATPEEAREFVGLPDVKKMQDRFMDEMEARMAETIKDLDPETFTKTWMPMMVQGWSDIQKTFWGQMGLGMPMGMGGSSSSDEKKK